MSIGDSSSTDRLNRCFYQRRIADARSLLLTFEHQPIATGPTTTFWGRSATTAQAKRICALARHAFLDVHYAEFSLPHVQQVADVEELLLAMQAKLSQWLRS
jgi:hypothetical protein